MVLLILDLGERLVCRKTIKKRYTYFGSLIFNIDYRETKSGLTPCKFLRTCGLAF